MIIRLIINLSAGWQTFAWHWHCCVTGTTCEQWRYWVAVHQSSETDFTFPKSSLACSMNLITCTKWKSLQNSNHWSFQVEVDVMLPLITGADDKQELEACSRFCMRKHLLIACLATAKHHTSYELSQISCLWICFSYGGDRNWDLVKVFVRRCD